MAARRGPELATQQLRREAVERLLLADPATSNRKVATAATVDPTTVATVRRELETNGRIPPRIPPVPTGHGGALLETTPGNTRALKHGVDSEARLTPLREQGEVFARSRWPFLDDARVALVADLSARVELARRWVEERGTVVRNRSGDVFPVTDRLERWSARLELLIDKLDREAREREQVDPQAALAAHLRALNSGEAA